MLYRVITTIEAVRMHVNPHGIWVPVTDNNFNTSVEVVGCGEIALRVGDWMPGKSVYLTEGCPVVIDDKFIREVIVGGKE